MEKWKVVLVVGIVIVGIGVYTVIGQPRANSSFSSQKVWSTEVGNYGFLKSSYPSMDANGDNKAEIMVEIENTTSSSYTVMVLNGADGLPVSSIKTFTDVAYTENGDYVAIEPGLWGAKILDTNGTITHEHHYMIFANHSNNKHISIYSLKYYNLNIKKYGAITIPSDLYIGPLQFPVVYYTYTFHAYGINNEVYLVYIGYYYGESGSTGLAQIEVKVMNETLFNIWSYSKMWYAYSGVYSLGADIVEFNGHGVNADYPTVMIVNHTSDMGNVSLEALDLLSGVQIWNTTVKGYCSIGSPVYALSTAYFFDYDNDGYTDIGLPTFLTGINETHLNIINSSGSLNGYYATTLGNYILPAYFTDQKLPNSHKLVRSIDMNSDGYGEIFFIDNNSQVICWDIQASSIVWTKPLLDQNYDYMLYLSTNDLNTDGVWDIYLIGMNNTNNNARDIVLIGVNSINGVTLTSTTYSHLVSGFSGTLMVKELSDINGDGLQDAVLVDGYYNSGSGVYVYAKAITLQNGGEIWNTTVTTDLSNTDYDNWTAYAVILGDVNGDATNDVLVKLYYHNTTTERYTTYLRILSGVDGTLIWQGVVYDDTDDSNLMSFKPYPVVASWGQFDYNDDGITNEIIITTSDMVNIYAVVGTVPEFSIGVFLLVIPAVLFFERKTS